MDTVPDRPHGWAKPWSKGLALGVVIAFTLPFLTVSCMGQEVMSISGIQLATGGPVDVIDDFSDSNGGDRVDLEGWATAGAILAIAAAVVAFIQTPWRGRALLFLGLGGSVSLLLLRVTLANEFAEMRSAGAVVTYTWGWWLALVGFMGLVAVNGSSEFAQGTTRSVADHAPTQKDPVDAFIRPSHPLRPDPPPAVADTPPTQTFDKFCGTCGAPFADNDRFCGTCSAERSRRPK